MVGTPFVEPTAPEFRTHQRAVGTKLFQFGKLLVDVGTCTEVHGPDQIVESVQGEVRGPVALEQGDVISKVGTYDVSDLGYITLIFSVRSIFVFYLYHDDGTAIGNRQVFHLLGYGFFKQSYTLNEVRIGFAQADILFLKQPPWQTTHFPLGANIRSGAKDDIHIILLAQTAELGQVVLLRKVIYAGLRFVRVPEYIEADGIHTQCFAQLDALVPIRFRDAWVVQFGGFNHKWFAIQQESSFAGFKTTLVGKAVEVPFVTPGNGDFITFEGEWKPYIT